MSSLIIEEEEYNNLSQINATLSYNSSDANQSYFDTLINIPDNNNHSSNENKTQNIIKNNDQEKNKIINEVEDLVKCYICLGQIKEPKMCRFCHRLACGNCLRQWLREKKTCGYCRKILTIVY